MDGLSASVVCVLVAYKDGISPLRGYDRSKRSDLEPGDLMVVNSSGVNGVFGKDIRHFAHITSGDAVICSSVN